jgi:hypothetical protein
MKKLTKAEVDAQREQALAHAQALTKLAERRKAEPDSRESPNR